MGCRPHLRNGPHAPKPWCEGSVPLPSPSRLMKHRTHDHLFAAAGVTAALSLIGTGATVLKGSVFHFDHWPLVAGDSSRATELPTAPIAAPEQQQAAAPGSSGSLLAGATRVGGTAAL